MWAIPRLDALQSASANQKPKRPTITRPTAVITAEVRIVGAGEKVRVEERTGPLLLVVTEGVYFGVSTSGGSGAPPACWFVFWDEIIRSTIPLSDLDTWHPQT